MLPSNTFVLELARQREDELTRRVRRGHVELANRGRWRHLRRRWQ